MEEQRWNWNPSDVPLKVFISDIHSMERNSDDLNYYHFRTQLVRKVDIMGVVTEVKRLNDDSSLYRVDDGTGEIMCRYNHLNPVNQEQLQEVEELQEIVAELNFDHSPRTGADMELILEDTFKRCHRNLASLNQGDCAHVQGFISTFHDRREVYAFRLYEVPQHIYEYDRISELSLLYSKVYSKFNG